MAGVRKENVNTKVVSGRVFRFLIDSWQTNSRTVRNDYREDITPARLDAPFKTSKLTITGGIANGRNSGCIYENWPVSGVNSMSFAHMSTPGTPTDNECATQVAAETNPSEPLVELGQTLAEIRDIPGQLKKRGADLYNSFNYKNRSLLRALGLGSKAAADLNLRYQFGIKPLITDILEVLKIRKSLNNKVRDLLRIEKNGGLVRKRVVYEETRSYVTPDAVWLVSHLGGANHWYGRITTTTYRKKWAYIRWVPDGTRKMPYSKDKDFHHRWSRSLFGLNFFNFRTVWSILPWTWLSDWYINCGEYLAATNNTVGVKIGAICVCEHEITEQQIRFSTKPSGVVVANCVRRLETKSRRNASLEATAKLPFLSARQASILASIANK